MPLRLCSQPAWPACLTDADRRARSMPFQQLSNGLALPLHTDAGHQPLPAVLRLGEVSAASAGAAAPCLNKRMSKVLSAADECFVNDNRRMAQLRKGQLNALPKPHAVVHVSCCMAAARHWCNIHIPLMHRCQIPAWGGLWRTASPSCRGAATGASMQTGCTGTPRTRARPPSGALPASSACGSCLIVAFRL